MEVMRERRQDDQSLLLQPSRRGREAEAARGRREQATKITSAKRVEQRSMNGTATNQNAKQTQTKVTADIKRQSETRLKTSPAPSPLAVWLVYSVPETKHLVVKFSFILNAKTHDLGHGCQPASHATSVSLFARWTGRCRSSDGESMRVGDSFKRQSSGASSHWASNR
jgi:hypothetical protein